MKRITSIIIAGLILFSMPVIAGAEKNPVQEEIFYRILVDRYNNGNYEQSKPTDVEDPKAYHGGDLKGITDKLDLFEEMGYTTLVLSPIMANAPNGYHGYWIEDFYEIEEQIGDMKSFNQLIDEAHKRDIKVVVELVANYIAASHPIAKDPTKEEWLEREEIIDAPWGDKAVKLNQENKTVQKYLFDVATYWVKETDIDGYLLHAADQSNPEFMEQLTGKIKKQDPNFYLLADVLEPDSDITFLLQNNNLDAVDNHDAQQAMKEVFSQLGKSPEAIYEDTMADREKNMLFLDDETMERFTQAVVENGRNSLTAWRMALTYLYSMPGVPIMFQGSELPMAGTTIEEVQRLVEFNSGNKDLAEFYKRISSLRNQFPSLRQGDYELVGSDGAMSVFKRIYDGQTMFIAINNDEKTRSISITDLAPGKQLRGYLGDHTVRENDNGEYKIGLDRETVEVFSVTEDIGLNWLFIGFVATVFLLFIISVIVISMKQKKNNSST